MKTENFTVGQLIEFVHKIQMKVMNKKGTE